MRTLFGILSFITILACAKISQAQETVSHRIDSLIKSSITEPDTSKTTTYATIAWETRYTNSILGLEYGTMAMQLAEKYDNYKMYQLSCVAVGTIERNLGNYDEAIRIYTQGLESAQKNGDREQLAFSYNNIGSVYYVMDSLDKAELEVGISLFMGNCLDNYDIVAYAEQNLGKIQYKKKEYKKSLETLLDAYKIRIEKNIKLNKLTDIVVWISKDYLALGKTKKAKEIILKQIKNRDTSQTVFIDMLYYQLAEIYEAENNSDSSIYYSNMARKQIYKKNFDENYKLLISIYYNNKEFKQAADMCREYEHSSDSILQSSIDNQNNEIRYTSEFYREQTEYQKLEKGRKLGRIIVLISIVGAILAILIVTNIIIFNRKNRAINKALRRQKQEIAQSIDYTQEIQSTMMTRAEDLGNVFPDRFILYMPRDIVSGDFYWQYETDEYEIIAVADCTGHGVPGALLSMLGISELQEAVKKETSPARILEGMRKKIKELMHQNDSIESQNDGMDIALIKVYKNSKLLEYSGAFIPMIYIRHGEIMTLEPTQNPVGIYMSETPFSCETVQMEPGDRIYLMTDGYCSQLNGKNHKRMNRRHFRKLLLENHTRTMSEQREALKEAYNDWKGSFAQIDDVTIIGLAV